MTFKFSPERVLLRKRMRDLSCTLGHIQRKGFAQGLREQEGKRERDRGRMKNALMGLEGSQHECYSVERRGEMELLESGISAGHEVHYTSNQGVWVLFWRLAEKWGTFKAAEWSHWHFALEGSLTAVCRRHRGVREGGLAGEHWTAGETSQDASISWQGHQLCNWRRFPGWWMWILRLLS